MDVPTASVFPRQWCVMTKMHAPSILATFLPDAFIHPWIVARAIIVSQGSASTEFACKRPEFVTISTIAQPTLAVWLPVAFSAL